MAETIKLSDEAPSSGNTFDQRLRRDEFELKRQIARTIMRLFSISNGVMLVALAVVFGFDQSQETADRLITENVIMTLVGATTVQLGIIMVTITKSMFPGKE